MSKEFVSNSDIVSLLKACAKQKDLQKGLDLHVYIQEHKVLEKNWYIASSLIGMYARCGALAKAQQLFDGIRVRDVIAWTALIGGYAQQGHAEEALKCFENMQQEGLSANEVTFICVLKACGRIGAAVNVEKIHDKIVCFGMLEKSTMLASILVDMYSRCGALSKAQRVLDEIPVQDVIMWTALMAGHVQHGHAEEALKCYDRMQHEGYSLDAVAYVCALKACGSIGAATKGEQIHDKVVSLGLLEKSILLGGTLIDMYARCGALTKAQKVLDKLLIRNIVMWTALIGGYIKQGRAEESLKCFESMQREGHSPDAVTFSSALKACGSIGQMIKGKQIHKQIVCLGMLENNTVLGSALVDMYAKCGALEMAQQVLDDLPRRSVIMWTALIAGYAQQEQGEEALKCFHKMQSEGHCPNAITFVSALKACGSIRATTEGIKIHRMIVSLGILEKEIVLGNTLVDMYSRCGALVKAQEVLDELSFRDVVTWNSLIGGYVQQGRHEEALKCFDSMQCEGLSPDVVSFMCALKACGSIGASAKGEDIHEKIVAFGLLESNVVLGSSLVDMYAKCAALARAIQILDCLPIQDVIMWTALITGYAQLGQIGEALDCFERMQSKGIKPDSATLVSMLNACCNSGLLHQAKFFFSRMSTRYGISPDLEHYSCMIDVFGRAGDLNRAIVIMQNMPSIDFLPAWLALVSACHKWGDLKIGGFAFEYALHLNENDPATYISMANLCAATGMQQLPTR